MTLPTITVKNGNGVDTTIFTPSSGRQAAVDSQSTVLSSEDLAAINAVGAKLPATLGAKLGAQSLSVVPASDTPFDNIATTYGAVIASNTITRPANTSPYAAGQIVGVTGGGVTGRFQFANVARTAGGVFRIERARLYKSQATAVGTFALWLYRGDPATTAAADQVAAATVLPIGDAAASTRLLGRINFDMTGAAISSLSGASGAEAAGIPIIGSGIVGVAGSAETAIYGVLVATSAYTPISGEAFSVVLEGYRLS